MGAYIGVGVWVHTYTIAITPVLLGCVWYTVDLCEEYYSYIKLPYCHNSESYIVQAL